MSDVIAASVIDKSVSLLRQSFQTAPDLSAKAHGTAVLFSIVWPPVYVYITELSNTFFFGLCRYRLAAKRCSVKPYARGRTIPGDVVLLGKEEHDVSRARCLM